MADFTLLPVWYNPDILLAIMQDGPSNDQTGSDNFYCGSCGAWILTNTRLPYHKQALIQCYRCKGYLCPDFIQRRDASPPTGQTRTKKIRCSSCLHLNLTLLTTHNGTTIESLVPGPYPVGIRPVNVKKYLWEVTCGKCRKIEVCALPLHKRL